MFCPICNIWCHRPRHATRRKPERIARCYASACLIAWHEAGHCVVGRVMGCRVTSVSVIPDANSGGRAWVMPDLSTDPDLADVIGFEQAIIYAGGAVAEALRLGYWPPALSGVDHDVVLAYVSTRPGAHPQPYAGSTCPRYQQVLDQARAVLLLDERLRVVEGLAIALYQAREIHGPQLERLLQEVRPL